MNSSDKHLFSGIRNSRMVLGEVYFWTDTVKDWKRLFVQEKYCQLVIRTWQELVAAQLVSIYAFVIMPNHLHVVWELLAKNGREMPHASFNKKTGHEIIKDLKSHHRKVLPFFAVDESERQYRIWQRDPLAVWMNNTAKVEQKIDYIHRNPLHERWNLAERPEDFRWSSARFYETGEDVFGILTHYMERF
jgi:REP element-mobilizing transposase RayT